MQIMPMSHASETMIVVHMLLRLVSSLPFPQFWLYVAPCPMLIVVSDWVKESSFLELSDRLALTLGFVISIKFSRPFYVVFYLPPIF